MRHTVWALRWTEYERGWGQRPDGFSFYNTRELADEAICADEAKRNADKKVPDDYSIPSGEPFLMECCETLATYVAERGTTWGLANNQATYMSWIAPTRAMVIDVITETINELEKAVLTPEQKQRLRTLVGNDV